MYIDIDICIYVYVYVCVYRYTFVHIVVGVQINIKLPCRAGCRPWADSSGAACPRIQQARAALGGEGEINHSIENLKQPHTSTRESTSQHHHTGGNPCVAKWRRRGGLRANRASVSLQDSLNMCTLFTEARDTVGLTRGKPLELYQLATEEERDPGLGWTLVREASKHVQP